VAVDPNAIVVRNRTVAASETIGFVLLAGIVVLVVLVALVPGLGAVGPGAPTTRLVTVCIAVPLITACAFFVVRAWQQIAVIDTAGIRVRNLTNTRVVAWSQLGGVDVGGSYVRGSVWWVARLILRDSDAPRW
jgi:Bacterial PH domain